MPTDDFVGHWQKCAVRTIAAFDPWLLTNAADPFVSAGRGISRAVGILVFETARIYILPTLKQRAEQRDLLIGSAACMDASNISRRKLTIGNITHVLR